MATVSTQRRLAFPLLVVAGAAFLVFFANQVRPRINDEYLWEPTDLFPSRSPAGMDFREGLYDPATAWLQGQSPYTHSGLWYPPFSVLFSLPFHLFDVNRAYIGQVGLLFALNIAAIGLAVLISKTALGAEESRSSAIALPVFLMLAFLEVSSYGFLFSVERGNFDIYPQFAALLGLWMILRKPSWMWPQVICFSVAAHLKVYPAILFVLVLWKHGWKSLLPLAAINAALLLSLGWESATQFLSVVTRIPTGSTDWVGNHSAASFARLVNDQLASKGTAPFSGLVFLLPPLFLWVFGAVKLLRRGYSSAGALWLYALSVPMMNLLPGTSHDYKLILLGAPLAMSVCFLCGMTGAHEQRGRSAQIVVLMGVAIALSVSYAGLPLLLGNKYLWVLAFQGVVLWALLTARHTKTPALGAAAPLTPEQSMGA